MSGSDKPAKSSKMRVAIIGAGIIGLCCARELAKRGIDITLFDQNKPGRGASWAAAGMLAPAFEAAHEPGGHANLFELCLQGAKAWTVFASELEQELGIGIGYVPGPSLAVAMDSEEAHRLVEISKQLSATGLAFRALGPAEAVALEPGLNPSLNKALQLPSDGHVDNRRVVEGLLQSCSRAANISLQQDTRIKRAEDLLEEFDHVVCTAGWQTADLVPEARHIKPIAGQMLSVERTASSPDLTIRSGLVYIAPKQDRIIIGATMEPGVVRHETDASHIERLRKQAEALCPGLSGTPVLETWAGVRPGTPDNAPMIGPSSLDHVHVAAGHYRNGILLAPITAQMIADAIIDGKTTPLAAAFSPQRFRCATV